MSMPQIPENPNRPSFKESIIDIIESIALEEVALSHIINAEAEKIQAFVGKDMNFPTRPNTDEVIKFNKTTESFFDTVLMKEWILYRKLRTILEVKSKHNYKNHDHDWHYDDKHEENNKHDKHHKHDKHKKHDKYDQYDKYEEHDKYDKYDTYDHDMASKEFTKRIIRQKNIVDDE